jgi:hypothetical protein
MSQRLVTSFINTNIPGAYPNVTVQSQPVGLGQSGILVIMGEADGGPSYTEVALKNNSFTVDQLTKVQNMYISGQIVDAFAALTAPSNDANITGSANQVYIVKTNTSSQASASVAANTSSPSVYGILTDRNYGINGNNYSYQVTSIQAEAPPAIIGGTITSFSGLSGDSFTVRLNGGAAIVVTLMGTITNVATLVTSLNNAFTAASITTLTAAPNALSPTTSIQITVNADPQAYSEGFGKAVELIDSTPGDLAALGLVAGITFSAAEPEVEVQISNASTGLNSTLDVTPSVALMIGYQGTTATLTINQAADTLTTTVTGGSGANLSLTLSNYKTVAVLASYIASQPGYSAAASPAAQQQPTSALDDVSAIGIASTGAGDMPGRVKNSLATFETVLGTSTALSFTATATAGLPAVMASPAFLTGGARGGTLAADIVNALQLIAGIQCNIIVPLFSEDATADIELGLTDPSSTYTIAAINAAVKNHCIEFSTPSLKRNRICILSYWTNNYTNAAAVAQGLANYRCSLTMQMSTQINALGVITNFMPWYTAVIAAGMQAGGFYKSICNKLANVISFTDPSGFDSGSPGDVEAALSAGLLFLTANTAGSLWVSDQTTYGFDTNFVYNSIQAVYDSDILALDLAASFQAAFVGQSLADVDAATALSYLSQKMEGYKKLKLIAASDDAPLGYKNASVSILAPTMTIQVEIKLATAIYFIPISINISQVQQSAG